MTVANNSKRAGWQKGRSGNPKGREKGALNKTTLALRERIEKEADPVSFLISVMRGDQVKRAPAPGVEAEDITPTLDQSISAARALTNKIAPDARDRPVKLDIGEIGSPADALAAVGKVLGAMGRGELSPVEAASVVSVVDSFRAIYEASELDKRIAALEQKGSV